MESSRTVIASSYDWKPGHIEVIEATGGTLLLNGEKIRQGRFMVVREATEQEWLDYTLEQAEIMGLSKDVYNHKIANVRLTKPRFYEITSD